MVLAPYHKRIVEDTAVHTYRTVNFILGQCGSPYYHAFGQIVVLTASGYFRCQVQIILSLIHILSIKPLIHISAIFIW